MRLLTAHQASEIDRIAQEIYGIPSIVLMENAGRSVAGVVLDTLGQTTGSSVNLVCGKGNNGGDGLVAARYLFNAGVSVTVYLLDRPENIKKDPKINHSILARMKVPIHYLTTRPDVRKFSRRLACSVIVDAIFGIGFSGSIDGIAYSVIERLNNSRIPVVSVDVPSGLDSTTGEIGTLCVMAKKTVTFGLPKKGLYINKGPQYAGEVIVKDIGYPQAIVKR